MTFLETCDQPSELITNSETGRSPRCKEYLDEVLVAKATCCKLLKQFQEHREKLRKLGSDVFEEFFRLVLTLIFWKLKMGGQK